MIVKDLSTLFIHIPKTGGTTLSIEILNSIIKDFKISDLNNNYETYNVDHRSSHKAHIKASVYKDNLENYDNYWKFSFIRNPFSQVQSFFTQLKVMDLNINPRFEPYKNMKFKDFIMRDDIYSLKGNIDLVDQKSYIHDSYGNLIVDDIFLYERYKESCDIIAKKLNIKINIKKKYRKTFNKEKYTPEMVERFLDLLNDNYEFYKEVKKKYDIL